MDTTIALACTIIDARNPTPIASKTGQLCYRRLMARSLFYLGFDYKMYGKDVAALAVLIDQAITFPAQ